MRDQFNSGWTIGDPLGSVQRDSRAALPKRFYKNASVEARDGGFALVLDGRAARTPGNRALEFPTQTLVEAVAAEWNAQTEFLDPGEMPLTRLANSAIDGVALTMAQTRADLTAYAASDLLCYRAQTPEQLAAFQAQAHDPVLRWAHDAFGADFIVTASVNHVAQPEAALAAIRALLEAVVDPFELAALHVLTTLTGSALLALAVAHGRLAADEAWRAAHVDEDFQISQWGEDDEAMIRRAARWREMQAAALMLAAARTSGE
jgi:chaperone required for assembly of F1-ATPase